MRRIGLVAAELVALLAWFAVVYTAVIVVGAAIGAL